MNSWYRGSFYSHEEEAIEVKETQNSSTKIVTGLAQLENDEIVFLVELIDNGFKEFTFNPESNELKDKVFESVLKLLPKEKIISVIKSLDKKNYLEKSELEPIILCPKCFSPKANIKYSCTSCSSIHLSKYETMEHTYCGYTDDKSAFIIEDKLLCPICKSDLSSIDNGLEGNTREHASDTYRITSALFKCNECKKDINVPNINFHCIDCGNNYNHIDSVYQTQIKYVIPESAFIKILSRNKVNLLIVEDYTPQADVVAMLLSSSGTHIEYKIAIAGNGSSAILALEENEFDIVLLDLGLPDINGLDLLRKIKTKWPNVEVIVLTGYDDIEIAVEAMKNGASEFLIKKDDAILNLPGILEKVMSKNTQE